MSKIFLEPKGIPLDRFALAIEVTTTRLSNLISGRARFTPTISARIGRTLGTSAELWLKLQASADARRAEDALKSWAPKIDLDALASTKARPR